MARLLCPRVAAANFGERIPLERPLRLTRPQVGVVTNIETDHISAFGNVEVIATEKGKLIAALPPRGTAVITPMTRGCSPCGRSASGESPPMGWRLRLWCGQRTSPLSGYRRGPPNCVPLVSNGLSAVLSMNDPMPTVSAVIACVLSGIISKPAWARSSPRNRRVLPQPQHFIRG